MGGGRGTTGPALAVAAAAGGLAAVAGRCAPARVRVPLAGILAALAGAAGVACGGAALAGHSFDVHLPGLLPLAGVYLSVDPLSGAFIVVTGAVVTVASVYQVGYASPPRAGHQPGGHGAESGRVAQATWPLFAVSLLLVPAAASVSTLLAAWELMAAGSLVLILSGHPREEAVREAGVWYAVMTHIGLVAILAGLSWLAAAGHGETFDALRQAHPSQGTRDGVFILALIGFGSKAGLVPLHAWLPRAHPEAPSPVSALMSAAMVNLGVYGIIRIDLQLLGPGPRWWGVTLLVVGGVSAVSGVLQATVATAPNRLLAYSTTENMGLIALALGAATLLSTSGATAAAAVAMAAALLHLIAHAAFKSLG